LNEEVTPFPFIWIALSGRGTVAKVNTETGEVLGEYLSAPNGRGRNPSRTTVDLNGNVWVGNRDESSDGKGSVVHIGLEENLQCVDRNGNGVIDTSTGLGDVKPWPNPGGVDDNGGVSSAEDECIINYVRVNGTKVRTVAVDPATNDVWVGGYTNRVHDLIDGDTGAILKTINPGCGGYGGLVDGNGVLWSAYGNDPAAKLLRYDPATDTATCLDMPRSYGLGIDSQGNIWNSRARANMITKLSPDGTIIGDFSTPAGTECPTGLAVNLADNNVWIANRYSQNVTRLDNNGNLMAIIPVGREPTGAAVDAAGKVWVTNRYSDNAMRIDPTTNTVDLTVNLGSGAEPYNYSDMTGSVILGTVPQGTWTVIHDSGIAGTPWGTISWHSNEPEGTSIAVRARSAEDPADLSSQPWVEVANGVEFTEVSNGRYLQIEARLTTTDRDASPILYDLTVTPRCGALPMLYIEPDSATTSISDTVTVDIRIRDVTNLYGVQLYLSFDPSLVEVVDAIPGGDVNIEPGDFITDAVVYINYVDNDTGEIEYVQTREGEVPGVGGRGVLARITFHGKAAGTSSVTFTLHILGDPMGVPIEHDYADGEIVVQGMGSVSGRVILERRVDYPNANAGATVELAGQSQVTGDDGYYSFSNVSAGTQRITVTHPSYLLTWRNVDVTAGATITLPDVMLLGGDCNTPQGTIDGVDAVTMGLAWDSEPGDAHWNSRADVRDDSVIDVSDLIAVKYNWGQMAPGPWLATASATGAARLSVGTQPSAAETTVVISPTIISTSVGMPVVVEVWVQDVEDLYGGGFQLLFNAGTVNVQDADPSQEGVQIESGNWLKRQLEVINSADNGYGRIDFFVTQRHPETPKSGSGVLARITFIGMEEGSATLHFDSVQLVDETANEILASAQDGTVVVQPGYRLYLPVVLRNTSAP
jgi:streptogramin lyase